MSRNIHNLRYVVRPRNILSTPRALSAVLTDIHRNDATPTKYLTRCVSPRLMLSYRYDVFMSNVNPENVIDSPAAIVPVYDFFRRHKADQRILMRQAGVNGVRSWTSQSQAAAIAWEDRESERRYVVRPLRHYGGHSFRITTSPRDFLQGTEYCADFFPKTREYRVIFVRGEPVVWLRKKPNDGVTNDLPWNHANSFFKTIQRPEDCQLAQTEFLSHLSQDVVIQNAHVVGVDVMVSREYPGEYRVLEYNLAPGLTIPENLAKVVIALQRGVST